MRVLLDEKPCDVTAESVNDAIAAAALVAEGRGRIIVDVFVNGARWSSDQLGEGGAADQPAEEVSLISADPVALVEYTFSQAADALTEADNLQRDAARLIQADQRREGFDALARAVTIWSSVQRAITDGSRLIGINLDEVTVGQTPIRLTIRRLEEQLQSLRGALSASDPISLADTLLYEMPAVVEEWRAMLQRLQTLAKAGPDVATGGSSKAE